MKNLRVGVSSETILVIEIRKTAASISQMHNLSVPVASCTAHLIGTATSAVLKSGYWVKGWDCRVFLVHAAQAISFGHALGARRVSASFLPLT